VATDSPDVADILTKTSKRLLGEIFDSGITTRLVDVACAEVLKKAESITKEKKAIEYSEALLLSLMQYVIKDSVVAHVDRMINRAALRTAIQWLNEKQHTALAEALKKLTADEVMKPR